MKISIKSAKIWSFSMKIMTFSMKIMTLNMKISSFGEKRTFLENVNLRISKWYSQE